jgi:hypothetical protein
MAEKVPLRLLFSEVSQRNPNPDAREFRAARRVGIQSLCRAAPPLEAAPMLILQGTCPEIPC